MGTTAFVAVITRHTLHRSDSGSGSLSRIAGMLRAGGVPRLRDLIYDLRPPKPPRRAHLHTEYSSFPWLLEPMLDVAGFDVAGGQLSQPSYGAHTRIKRP